MIVEVQQFVSRIGSIHPKYYLFALIGIIPFLVGRMFNKDWRGEGLGLVGFVCHLPLTIVRWMK